MHTGDWICQSGYRHGIWSTRGVYRSDAGQHCVRVQADLGVGTRRRSSSLVLAHQQPTPGPCSFDLGTYCRSHVLGLSQYRQLCSLWCIHLPGIIGAVYVVRDRHQLHAPCQTGGWRTTCQLVPRSIWHSDQYLCAGVYRMDDGNLLLSPIPAGHGR